MILRNLNRDFARGRIAGTPYVGVRGDAIPESGGAGASVLANDRTLPGDAAVLLRARIVTWPAAGDVYMFEDGSFDFVAPDGSYTLGYRLSIDGVESGTTTVVTLNVGNVLAPGATLTGSASLTPGAATAGASAPGATLTGTASLTAGGASGGGSASASAPGATLTGTGTLIAGNASGPFSPPADVIPIIAPARRYTVVGRARR